MARKTFLTKFMGWKTSSAIFPSTQRKSHTIPLIFWMIIILINLQARVVIGQQRGDEVCETLPSEIHLTKGEKN